MKKETIESKWHERYLDMAKLVGSWSKDPSSKIGAVVIGMHGQVLSTGFNGFPRKINDTEERLNDREKKYKFVIHAEMNCIYNASLTGISLEGSTIYVHGLPCCSECTKGIIQSGITRVVIPRNSINKSEQWAQSWNTSVEMLKESGVTVTVVDYEDTDSHL